MPFGTIIAIIIASIIGLFELVMLIMYGVAAIKCFKDPDSFDILVSQTAENQDCTKPSKGMNK